MNQPSGSAGSTALKPSNARQSKRLFVHEVPSSATDEILVNFFNLQLNGLNVTSAPDPCISAQLSDNRSFALMEFKSPGDATVALALDGIHMEDGDSMDTSQTNGHGSGLSIRRPKDYIVPSAESDEATLSEGISTSVPDTANKVSISNILPDLTGDQVTELLAEFGALKAFVLVVDTSTQESRVSPVLLEIDEYR